MKTHAELIKLFGTSKLDGPSPTREEKIEWAKWIAKHLQVSCREAANLLGLSDWSQEEDKGDDH